ncbi:hypothetical protein DPEC_G00306330 [Dallia pectoralis]|uniref:Uncharacterized protein n=1 Tax=Dallia pectoralis TaxID=75939 RepID=A0ACC2FE83_DALPE|nr:hypothetical protein DPEC_G00306330 [Dallia pectoralis]
MATGAAPYPSVFMVDTHAAYPPLPPKLKHPGRRGSAVQYLLFLLIALAFCGLAIEACFIYHLYSRNAYEESGSIARSVQDEQDILPPIPVTQRPNPVVLPSKPVAHLTAAPQKDRRDGVLVWNMDEPPLLYGMKYKDGKLVIGKEGYYYVYSKIVFSMVNSSLEHSVCKFTPRYSEQIPITLLQSKKYYPKSDRMSYTTNSYLGGVFHFFENDSIVVRVKHLTQVRISESTENVFGVFMI